MSRPRSSASQSTAKKSLKKAAESPSLPAASTPSKKKPGVKAQLPARKQSQKSASANEALPARRPQRPSKKNILLTYEKLCEAHPDAHCELDHESTFQLLVATVLSAQTTDVAVNRVTPALFEHYPTAHKLAQAQAEQVESLINKIGMFRQKAKNIIGLSQRIEAHYQGEVPDTLEELITLPGVGRKTANVVLGVAFGKPEGVVVDTHVSRITQRLGWTQETSPEKIEQDLMKLFPVSAWDRISHTLIFHGRRICSAQRPSCSSCPVHTLCPSAFHAEHVGRKPPSSRRSSPST